MKLEKLVLILCIVGLILVMALALFVKPIGSYTELYFDEHTELPSLIDYATPFIASQEGPFLIAPSVGEGWEKLGKEAEMRITSEPLNFVDLNKTYNVSFTVVSNENKRTRYLYTITTYVLNKTGTFELEPGSNITINITVQPTRAEWKLNTTKSERWHDILDITNDSWLAGGGGEMSFRTITDTANFRNFPVSHNVDWFGEILQTNLSFDELAKKPYTKHYEYAKTEGTEKSFSVSDVMLWVSGNKMFVDVNRTELMYTSKIQKFQVNLIKSPGAPEETSQEIHFWYQIREIGQPSLD